MIYFTSDWHLGWTSTLKFDQRPFATPEEQDSALLKRFNNILKYEDTIYFLGDMGKPSNLKSIITQINGKKILILGNHDKGPQAMLECGFDVVLNSASYKLGKTFITMSHYPIPGRFRETVSVNGDKFWHGDRKHTVLVPDLVKLGSNVGVQQVHLHGHIHSPNPERKSHKIEISHPLDKNGNMLIQYDVGVKANNYMPVSLSQIESLVAKHIKEKQAP